MTERLCVFFDTTKPAFVEISGSGFFLPAKRVIPPLWKEFLILYVAENAALFFNLNCFGNII